MTLDQKAELLAARGVDRLTVLSFTAEVAALAPEAFAASVLAGALGARGVVVGEEFRFGRGRAGDVGDLRRLGSALGFEVEAIPGVLEEGRPVSSTRIRERLAEGDVEAARRLLGRPHFVEGIVVRGEGRGRTLGIPTANLAVENEVLPREGVYVARAAMAGAGDKGAVVNLGRRPTFGGGASTTEAHLLDFEGDLYGSRLRVCFLARLRDELAFSGRDALVAQVQADIRAARAVLDHGADAV
jgi:riboflavin kinase/FMN adenylyltransferase